MNNEVTVVGFAVGGLLAFILLIMVISVGSQHLANTSKLQCIEKMQNKTAAEIKTVCE